MRRAACGLGGWALLAPAAFLAGCAAWTPRPIEPAKVAAGFRARRLDDPGLRAYLAANLPGAATRARGTLDLAALTLVAFYFHPDLDVARARVEVAEGGIVTAGGRPNPVVFLGPEYNADSLVTAGTSPWLANVAIAIPIETAGKRGYRIERARHLTEAARLELADVVWRVRSQVRATLAEHLLARRELELLEAEEGIRAESVAVMEKRLAAGDVSRPDVDLAQAELASTHLAARTAQTRLAESRASLAHALGLPPAALDGVRLVWPELDGVPAAPPALPAELQRQGLVNRADVRRALAEYAAAEAQLRLEIARQYPDLQIGPGYKFDQGDNKFSIGVSLTLPILNRNEGPIAEAEGRRRELSARFLAIQSAAIGEIERALDRYGAVLAEAREAEAALAAQGAREQAAARALELGESDRLTLVGARLGRALAARARLEALRRAHAAAGALEDAVQRPLGGAVPPEPPSARPRVDR
jgi:outer membrane protein TolC